MKTVGCSAVLLIINAGNVAAQAIPASPIQPLPVPVKSTQLAQAVACDSACIRGNMDRAVQACAPRVEAEAPGDYDWLIRPYGSIFQEADSPEQPSSAVVRYRGDSIRFLNPQKEWVRAIYECGYDTAKQQVVSLRVRLGVIGKVNPVPVLPAPKPQARAPQPPPGPAAPGPAAPGQAQPPAPATAPTVDRRRVGEPNDVSVLQIKSPPGAR